MLTSQYKQCGLKKYLRTQTLRTGMAFKVIHLTIIEILRVYCLVFFYVGSILLYKPLAPFSIHSYCQSSLIFINLI